MAYSYGPDGYPVDWQLEYPPGAIHALGMPIWTDSWGPPPPLVYYGNGTSTPGPLLPIYQIAVQLAQNPTQPPVTPTVSFGRGVWAGNPWTPPPAPPPSGPLLGTLSIPPMSLPNPITPVVLTTDPAAFVAHLAAPDPELNAGNEDPPIGASMANPITFFNPLGSFGAVNTAVNPISAGGVISGLAGADACSYLPASYQAACRAALGIAGTVLGGGGTTSTSMVPSCSPGYTWSSALQRCVAIQNALPGGDPLTQSRGVAVAGGLGLAAVQPVQVGTITRSNGTTGPILKCPRRYVLGMDYLCYPKGMIPNKLRAHPRGARPFLTGGEVKILNKARSLSKRAGKMGTRFGPKHCHCSKKGSPSRRKA